MSLGGPVWGIAVALMLVTVLVLTVVRLKRSSDGPMPLLAAGITAAAVVAGIAVLLALSPR